MKYAAININFDSIAEMYGFPESYRDPTFHEVADRFFEISDRYNFKYSIYVVGRDLEDAENRARIRDWARDGHEIGNHSWSHLLSLGALPEARLRQEVEKAHKVIAEAVGQEPRGFIAPGWSGSAVLRRILMDLGYEYDTSLFPSVLMYPFLFKVLLNHIGDRRFSTFLRRKDLHYPLVGNRMAHIDRWGTGRLAALPLPATRLRLACWHTTAFLFGWRRHKRLLRTCLDEIEYFYYLVHPADLVVQEDLDPARTCRFERMEYDLETKIELFTSAIEEIVNRGRKLVTMHELAERLKQSEQA